MKRDELSLYPEPPLKIKAQAGCLVLLQLRNMDGTFEEADRVVVPVEKVELVIERLREAVKEARRLYARRNDPPAASRRRVEMAVV